MQPWKYVGLKQLDSNKAYEADLDARLSRVADEDAAQSILNEITAWEEFNEAVKDLESRREDPADDNGFFDAYRYGATPTEVCYAFKHGPFTIVYFRDPVKRLVIPVVVFHRRDEKKRLKELTEFLHGKLE